MVSHVRKEAQSQHKLIIKNGIPGKLVNTSVTLGEDTMCVKPCMYFAQSIYIIEEHLYYYRQNPTSIVNSLQSFSLETPLLMGKHLEKQIPMDQFDFQDQVYRLVVHYLFVVAVSQFNRQEPYRQIKADIRACLADPYYQQALRRYRFNLSARKRQTARLSLKHGWYGLMFLDSRYRSYKRRKLFADHK